MKTKPDAQKEIYEERGTAANLLNQVVLRRNNLDVFWKNSKGQTPKLFQHSTKKNAKSKTLSGSGPWKWTSGEALVQEKHWTPAAPRGLGLLSSSPLHPSSPAPCPAPPLTAAAQWGLGMHLARSSPRPLTGHWQASSMKPATDSLYLLWLNSPAPCHYESLRSHWRQLSGTIRSHGILGGLWRRG